MPAPSRSRDGRCPPSAPRRRPELVPSRPHGHRVRSSQRFPFVLLHRMSRGEGIRRPGRGRTSTRVACAGDCSGVWPHGCPSGVGRGADTTLARVRGPHQAPCHRAAPGHDRPGDVPRRPGVPAAVDDAPDAPRRLDGGCRCQRDQPGLRPRHRRGHGAHPAAPARHGQHQRGPRPAVRDPAQRGLGGPAGADRQRPVGAPGGRGHRLLRVHLHDAAQAPDGPEHRLGWCGRVLPGADRLGGDHRLTGADAVRALRHRVLLDATALLAPGAALQGRLPGGPGADAPGGRRQQRGRLRHRRATRGPWSSPRCS